MDDARQRIREQERSVGGTLEFFLPVLPGNTLGRVVLVRLSNYAQTGEKRMEFVNVQRIDRLTPREWLSGGLAGRPHVAEKSDDACAEYPNQDDSEPRSPPLA